MGRIHLANTKTPEEKAAARGKQADGRARAATRRNTVLGLRVGGASQRQVAAAVNVSLGQVSRDYRQAIKEMVDANVAEEVRVMTMERYSRLFLAWWNRAIGGMKDGLTILPDPKAAGIILDILRNIRQLHGLDPKPQVPGDSPMNPLWTAPLDDRQREWLSDLTDREKQDLDDQLGTIFDQHRDGHGVEGGS